MKTNTNTLNLNGTILQKSTGWYTVSTLEGKFLCSLSARLAKGGDLAAVGDRVQIEPTGGERGQIVEILPRRNQLSRLAAAPRPGAYPVEQVFAANLDLIVPVLSAANPAPRWGLLDRYLVLAESRGLPALVIVNKIDLLDGDPAAQVEVEDSAAEYRRIGYPVLAASAATGAGLEEMRAALTGRTVIFLGHSGVGKTSLLNALQPGLNLRTGAVKEHTGKGRHTTTAPTLFTLEDGLEVMDTPGVREFGLWDIEPDELAQFFPEMRPYLGQCRFRLDCGHDEEPGCAVRKAVTAGSIHPLRYQSYLKLKANG